MTTPKEPNSNPGATPSMRKPFVGPAAGVPAVLHSLRYAKDQMGVGRSAKTLLKVNQPSGFDCPGCAWPEPHERSLAEFCENGARAVAHEATNRVLGADFFAKWSLAELQEKSDYWLEQQGRLTVPLHKAAGATHYEPIEWDDALAKVANVLQAMSDPNEAVFYTSGRTSNEAAFLYQLFVRQLGTNNFPDCSNMCHESSGTGLSKVIGIGKGTVGLPDFEKADLIFVVGQNPGTNHPRMLRTLAEARARGAHVVSINPIRERALERFADPQTVRGVAMGGAEVSSHYLQVKVGGDIALFKGIMKGVLQREHEDGGSVLDHDFIREHTAGFDSFREALAAISWEQIESDSGISRGTIEEMADLYCRSEAVIACWAMGLTQHKHGVANIREVVNLLLLRGNLGRAGAGVCPVRGHSNVQGDRTMGIWERPSEAFLERLEKTYSLSVPRAHGYDTVAAIRAMEEGRVSVFFCLGGNFARATPDTARTARAISQVGLTVQVSTKLNRSHLDVGKEALVLPCLGRTELDEQAQGKQFVTVENSMGIVHRSQGALPPAGKQLRSEPWIVAQLAQKTLGDKAVVDFVHLVENYDRIRDEIAKAIAGFDDMNRRVRQKNGFLLPNPVRERVWRTANEKANFTVQSLPDFGQAKDELILMTLRSHDQYNTTLYGLDDRYRGVYGRRDVLFLSPEEMKARALQEGQLVDVTSRFQNDTRAIRGFFRVTPLEMPPGCAAAYFPEANELVHRDSVADESHTPTSKSVIIRVQASREALEGGSETDSRS